jgi:glycosyltransferase involved in cell wall biosynthesis
MTERSLKTANQFLRDKKYAEALEIYSELKKSTDFAQLNSVIEQNIEYINKKYSTDLDCSIESKNNFTVGSYIQFQRAFLRNKNTKRICLVTDELAGTQPSGGIGAAFLELARGLVQSGFQVDILYSQARYFDTPDFENALRDKYKDIGANIFMLNPYASTTPAFVPSKISYAIYKWLEARDNDYLAVHFHDYKGFGFFSALAKAQGLSLLQTKLVVQIHGPSRWALEANSQFFSHPEQLRIDYLEKVSVELSDYIVAPSKYILDWIDGNNFNTEKCKSKLVIPNCLPPVKTQARPNSNYAAGVKTFIFFGRHEQRKGLRIFCEALNLAKDSLASHGIKIVFLGGLGVVNDAPSLFHLESQAINWHFDFELVTNLNRDEALDYILKQENPLVCICSPYENSPYTVFEVMHLGLPLVASNKGGAIELFADANYPGLIEMIPKELARVMIENLNRRMPAPESANTAASIVSQWVNFHESLHGTREISHPLLSCRNSLPLISVVVVHHERPKKLADAVDSIISQKYPRIELIVVDDGSRTSETLDYVVQRIEPKVHQAGGKVIYRENGYLGAARNTGLNAATGDYICFLDDDDYALPNMISDLFIAAKSSAGDFVVALNTYMPVEQREKFIAEKKVDHIASYIPTGGPHSLGCLENCFGAATGLFNVRSLRELGGYSEIQGVGHEDYELYTKISSKGKRIWILPRVLYFYEVGRPSMLSQTSLSENFSRNHSEFVVDHRSQDLVKMLVGKKLEADKSTRIVWQMSGRNSDLLHAVFQNSHSRNDCLNAYLALLEYENKISSKFYSAIKEDIHR